MPTQLLIMSVTKLVMMLAAKLAKTNLKS